MRCKEITPGRSKVFRRVWHSVRGWKIRCGLPTRCSTSGGFIGFKVVMPWRSNFSRKV